MLETGATPVLPNCYLKRMRECYGEPVETNSAKAVKRSVNLVPVIFAQVYYPAFANGLKDTAGFLGFKWTAAEFSGRYAIACR